MDEHRFVPAWWLPGPHLQTTGARLLRPAGGVQTTRERVELPDGDFLDLDWLVEPAGSAPEVEAPLVIILHGLEGSASSKYVLETHRALARRGLASVALNFRSCSGEANRLPRFYHSGDTADLGFVLDTIHRRFSGRPLCAVGFSLGGNVLLKYLGEKGRDRRDPRIVAAVAISVPFDLAAGLRELETGVARFYQNYLLRKMRRKIHLKRRELEGQVDLPALMAVGSLRQFDELCTAPLHGFDNAEDYYARSSSNQFVGDIEVSTLLVQAADDPFLPAEAIPHRQLKENPHIEARVSASGGHVGFVTGWPWAPVFWSEDAAAAFLSARLTLESDATNACFSSKTLEEPC
jgi:predicted alpha/beta-fold hydrolase